MEINDYIKKRLKTRARQLHRKKTILTIWVNVFKSYLYIVGAVSSILGLLGLEVRQCYVILHFQLLYPDLLCRLGSQSLLLP